MRNLVPAMTRWMSPIPLAAARLERLTPCRAATPLNVSPGRTVYVGYAAEPPATSAAVTAAAAARRRMVLSMTGRQDRRVRGDGVAVPGVDLEVQMGGTTIGDAGVADIS